MAYKTTRYKDANKDYRTGSKMKTIGGDTKSSQVKRNQAKSKPRGKVRKG